MKSYAIATAAMTAFLAINVTQASALSMKDCSTKYKAAQTDGTLNGQKWNDFRKAQCGADATVTPASATTTAATTPAPAPAAKPAAPAPKTAEATKPAAAPAAAPAATSDAVFPSAVSTKYASESAGKARMHTCLDQYNANKATNGNGGLKWIQKGGGYYSQCNTRIKS
jgi:hypothetical protein